MLVDDEFSCQFTPLPAHVQDLVSTHGDLWNFSKYNKGGNAADVVAKHLWDRIEQCPEKQKLEAIAMLNGAGFIHSKWLHTNAQTIAEFMAQKFVQLKADEGHGRIALAVAYFGGPSMCRQVVSALEDKEKAAEVLYYVASQMWKDRPALAALFNV